MKTPSPLHTFRVYPGSKKGKYYIVSVFSSLKAMRQYCRRNCSTYDGGRHNMLGICHSYTKISYRKHKRGVVSRNCGSIHFTARANTEIVSHEMTHAALYFVTDVKHEYDVNCIDEPLAMAQGWLLAQATHALHDLGVWK